MTEIAGAIFAVPPFPGAKPHPLVRPMGPASEAEGAPVDAAQLIAAMRQARVGGAFWRSDDIWSSKDEVIEGSGDDPRLLLAAMAGKLAHSRSPGLFSALYGLLPGSPQAEAVIEDLVERHLLRGVAYADPFTGAATSPLPLVETLAGWRALIDANRPITAAFGFANWKRDTVDPLLWGGAPVPFRTASDSALKALPKDAVIAIWKARVPPVFLAQVEAGPWRVWEVEDGFIRSAGLGADCVPPLSIIVDEIGVHYDPHCPSRLETMLAADTVPAADLARAARLREWLVREGVSKYGVGAGAALPRAGGDRRHILVVGQVEDDRSILFGGGDVRSNLELLRRVRAAHPNAWIVYRPHPDVEAGHRRGAIPARTALQFADQIAAGSPISALIAMVDEVQVISSLTGFEALLHGKKVTTHGMPFFAGWGLTHDIAPISSRRGRKLTLDELVATVLLRCPRYLDPLTNLPCTAEILIMRLLSGVQRENIALVPLRRLVGWAKRAAAQFVGNR
jgi:capsular polysaccharide export protein